MFSSKAWRNVWIPGTPGTPEQALRIHLAGKELSVPVRDERGDFVLWPHSAGQNTISCPLSLDPLLPASC